MAGSNERGLDTGGHVLEESRRSRQSGGQPYANKSTAGGGVQDAAESPAYPVREIERTTFMYLAAQVIGDSLALDLDLRSVAGREEIEASALFEVRERYIVTAVHEMYCRLDLAKKRSQAAVGVKAVP